MKKLLAILLVLCPVVFGQNQKPRFVVSVSGELEVNIADVLADEISYAIIKSGKYDLIANDRQFKDALKKEWKNGNVDDDKIIALAKKAGADYICFAKIKSLLGSNQVTAQLVDLKTMLYGSMGKANGALNELDQLTKISQAVVADMLGIAMAGGIGTSDTFTDSRDSKTYKMVKIGEQVWMAEDLNYNASGSKCYKDDPDYCDKYGRLYNWETAKKVCPKDWHLPTKSEWEVLTAAVDGEKTEGKHLKSKSGWNDDKGKSGNGLNTYGFSALPGGYGNSVGSFGDVGSHGYWWSASEYNSDRAYYRNMSYSKESASWFNGDKSFLFSVRCIKD